MTMDMDSDMDSIVIGIDLGTTNSCASYFIDGKLKILENKEGGRITPSFLFFSGRNPPVLVGEYAKHMADQKPERGVYEMKRLIGREFRDKCVQEKQKYYPFTIKEVDGKLTVEIKVGEEKWLTKSPQELSSLVLQKIKADVDERLGGNITKAVISVPAYFNSLQRKETLEAAKEAGFTVLKLFNEPNAAALNYYYENPNHCQYLLVYDLGGGTFDVSILKKSDNNVEVLCVDGDSHLGGNDFDDLIVDFVADELRKKFNIDVMSRDKPSDKRQLMRLNRICEEAKRKLSDIGETQIFLEKFVEGEGTVSIPFTRKQFESLIDALVLKTVGITKRCIASANIEKNQIERVVLAGGSTHIPKVQNLLSNYFGEEIIEKSVNPDECVAFGAALQAAMLSQHPRQGSEKIKITDVVPLSIGQRCLGGNMDFLIKKNTPIPVSITKSFVNLEHNQEGMMFIIYEGERLDPRKNNELGRFRMKTTPAPPGECRVFLTLHIDSTGILTCTAVEEISGNRKVETIDFYTRGIRSDSEVKEAIKDAENNQAEDEEFRAYSDRIAYLKDYCATMTYNLTEENLNVSHKDVFDRCEQMMKQMNANIFYYKPQSIDNIIEELTEKCDPFVKHYKFDNMPTRRF